MNMLPREVVRSDVSFVRDPEALACLLDEIRTISAHQSTPILFVEIFAVAKNLGYRGSVYGVRRFLLGHGYVSECEKRINFRVTEENGKQIDYFFLKHAQLFAPQKLSDREQYLLFLREGKGGTATEILLTHMLQMLSGLLVDTGRIPALLKDVSLRLLDLQIEHFFALEQVKETKVVFDQAYTDLASVHALHGITSLEFFDASRRCAIAQRNHSYALSVAEEKNRLFSKCIREKEILVLLGEFGASFGRLSALLLKAESGD